MNLIDNYLKKIQSQEDLTETFRELRKLCSQNEDSRLLCERILVYCLSDEGIERIKNNFIAFQFIANATVSKSNCKIFLENLHKIEKIVETAHDKLINAVFMAVHNCYLHFDDFQLTDQLICSVIQFIELEFPLIVAEDIVKGKQEVKTEKFFDFLQVISSHTFVHPLISIQFLNQVKEKYKQNVDSVLKSEISPENVTATQAATEFLAIVSAHHHDLQQDKALLTSVIYLLKMAEESKHCEPKREIEELKKMGRHEGILNFKSDLIKLSTNLCHRNVDNQNLALECGLVNIVLDNMRYDAMNPFIRETCIHCIKVLCEDNLSVQEYVAKFTPVVP